MINDKHEIKVGDLRSLIRTRGLVLVDARDLSSLDDDKYCTTSSDPHVVFSLSEPTSPRDCQLLIKLEALPLSESSKGAIYWDVGYGFNELDKLDFDYDDSGITWIYAEGIAKATSLRWDPTDKGSINLAIKSIAVFALPDINQYLLHLNAAQESKMQPFKFALMIEVDRTERISKIESKEIFEEFDRQYYLERNPDISQAGVDPLNHYIEFGWMEGRSPSPHFQINQWLASNDGFRRAALSACDCLPRNLIKTSSETSVTKKPKLDQSHRDLLSASRKRSILFVGYFEASLGLGDAARGTIKALAASKLPHSIYPFNKNVEDRFLAKFKTHLYDQYFPHVINVFEMSADQLPLAFDELGSWRVQDSYNVFRAYWELADAPEAWRAILTRFNEIWAPSKFVADSFRQIFEGEIHIVPPFVDVKRNLSFSRDHFGIDQRRFYFLTSFDILSGTARKNPLAVLEAFSRAFPTNADVGLIMKCVGAETLEDPMLDEIVRISSSDDRIIFIRKNITRDEMISLIDVSDCYISLHRSEGFGLGLAEAMSLQKPVISTDYSGSVDFIHSDRGYPVKFSLTPVKEHEYIFASKQQWAEPCIECASSLMLRIFNDEADRTKRAMLASLFIRERYGAENVRMEIEKRASEIFRRILPNTSG